MQGDQAPGKAVDASRSRKAAPAHSVVVAGPTDQALAGQGLELPGNLSPESILALQRTVGNRAVQRLLVQQAGPAVPIRETPIFVYHSIARSIQRFSAEPHEQISAAGLRGSGYSARQMEDIQLGNWATDINQISLVAPHLHRYLGFTLTGQEQFLLAQLLAVGRFGEQVASRMAQQRFGGYQASEHFDNPASANTPREQRAVASHIAPGGAIPAAETGIGTIENNLRMALDAGRTSVGLQHYGRAMHIMEDFFAHTNFVRIAVRLVDATQPEPYGGGVRTTGEQGARYQLTSGIFDMADTVMSILHLLIAEITKPAEPGRITAGDRITQMIVNHVSPALGRAFAVYLRARSAVSRARSAVSSTATRIAEAVSPEQWVENRARELARRALETGVNVAMQEVGQRVTGTGTQPSHTRMNVDDPTVDARLNPISRDLVLFPIARDLAQHVVTQVDPLMQAAWRAPTGQPREDARQALFDRVERLLVYPERSRNGWWRSIVTQHTGNR